MYYKSPDMASAASSLSLFSHTLATWPHALSSRSLQLVANTMSSGGACVGGNKKPPPPRVHPRCIPIRGTVLKGIIRGMLRLPPPSWPVSTVGGRVRPAPPSTGGGVAAEQGKLMGIHPRYPPAAKPLTEPSAN